MLKEILSDILILAGMGTITLLLSMMVLVAAIRLSGIFDLVAARLSGLAGYPKVFRAAIIAAAGVLSALFLNDTMCLVLWGRS
jgi:Na+/H+ antiporter NhaD/arsenite permease-like protein